MDLRLRTDSRNDLDITNGELSFVTGIEALAQRVQMKLQSFLGESVYDLLGGTAWINLASEGQGNGVAYVFENTSNPQATAELVISESIKAVEGVAALLELNVVIDSATRVATITGKAQAQDSQVFSFGGSVGP